MISNILHSLANMTYEDRYKEFEQYLTSGEPRVKERARN